MKKMNFLRTAASFAVAGAVFLTGQAGFAQDDVFDFFGTDDVPVAEVEGDLADLFPGDAVLEDEAVPYELPEADAAALTGEGMLEATDAEQTPAFVAPRTSLILDAAPEEPQGTTVPVLPPPTAPKTTLMQVPQPPQQPAPMAAAPVQQPQPGTVSYQDCPDFCPPELFQGRCRGIFAGRHAGRFAPAHRPEPRAEGRGGNSRQPMVDPYYTLRGPRHFDDPNPRPIGP